MVGFTVFIAIASATAGPIPSSENGWIVCISSQGYLWAHAVKQIDAKRQRSPDPELVPNNPYTRLQVDRPNYRMGTCKCDSLDLQSARETVGLSAGQKP
jgi:hypothetical protein